MEIKERIKKLTEIGFPLSTLANQIDVHYTTISKWLSGERKISNKMEQKIKAGLENLKKKIEEI